MAVARSEHDGQVGIKLAYLLREFDAADAGHHHIGEYDVVTAGMTLELVQRFRSAMPEFSRIAELAQRVGGEGADIAIVLDHQHR